MDVVIRGGTVATGGGAAVTDVGIDGGKIVQLGGSMTATCFRVGSTPTST
jgi:dihydroorotase-like cyclic amidohydrolase